MQIQNDINTVRIIECLLLLNLINYGFIKKILFVNLMLKNKIKILL